MRIGIDVYQTCYQYGGIARYVRALVTAMAAVSPADEFVLTSNSFRALEVRWRLAVPNARHVNIRVPRRLMQACWDRLGWPPIEAFTGPLDVFHGTHFVLPPARAAHAVLTVHDLNFLRNPQYFLDRPLNVWGHQRELPVALSRAEAVIAVSDHTRKDLIELMGVPSERIRVIPEGVEPHFFVSVGDPRLEATKTRLGLDRPYLVFLVGTPEPRKNLLRTVEAARRAAADLPLVIIGPQEPIRTLLEGNTRGVILVGSLADEDLPLVLHGAEIALYPSLAEGFGLPAVEAMAAGVPLITSDRSSLPEVVGKAAVLVDPESVEEMAHAIRSLLGDTERRAQLVEQGLARARELSWERAAHQVLCLYRELASPGSC
ncbi:MAG: glycosyltransferase family 1 protein [Nitrospirota bacterium]